MKRLFMALALSAMVTMPLGALDGGLPKSATFAPLFSSENAERTVQMKDAPMCDMQKIAAHEVAIKQAEYRNALMRAGIYACVFAGASYMGYKFFNPTKIDPADAAAKLNFTSKEIEALKVVAANTQVSFLSMPWIKNALFGMRDMLIQSAGITGLYTVGSYLNKNIFYGKRLDEFFIRSTNIVRVKADIEGYASMLEAADYGVCYRSELQVLVKDRALELCKSVETIIAYMHMLRDSLEIPSKNAFVVAEQYLIMRTNAALESLWQFATNTEKKPLDIARGLALTMAIFTQDFGRAIDRFDGAYYVATHNA